MQVSGPSSANHSGQEIEVTIVITPAFIGLLMKAGFAQTL